jgi:hypothetical protein
VRGALCYPDRAMRLLVVEDELPLAETLSDSSSSTVSPRSSRS